MDSAANTGSRKRKAYTIKLKLEACEYAEQSSNEKAAKHFQVGLYCVRYAYLKSPQKVRQVDNVLIDAGSRIEAGSQIQAGDFRSLVLIEAGGFYLRFYGMWN